MRLQIDTKSKEIVIEESVNLEELFKMLKQLFPNDAWKSYKLKSQVITNWSSPIIIRDYYPNYPWIIQNPTWTCDDTCASNETIKIRNTSGISNIDTVFCVEY